VRRGAETRLLAVLGDPVAHSVSPAMHSAAIGALGLDAVYVALRTPAEAVPTVMAALSAVNAAGNVTVPHKAAVEGCVARKTDACARAGACNTFWVESGQLVGDNTDVAGVEGALAALGAADAGHWLVIGTGGAARAVAVAAAARGAHLAVRSRATERGRQFAAWAQSALQMKIDTGSAAWDVAINATPLGLSDDDTPPLALEELGPKTRVLDLVYRAGETRWVREARAAGHIAADGREMLVRQGASAFERFFPGTAAPIDVMRAAVARALRA
jgi:shikimate dehydrogenase